MQALSAHPARAAAAQGPAARGGASAPRAAAAQPRRSARAPQASARGDAADAAAPAPAAALRSWALGLAAAAAVLAPPAPLPAAAAAPPAQELFQLAGLGENPIKNARALLRNSLPISNKPIRVAQNALETITEDLRVPGVRFSGVESSVRRALQIVRDDSAKVLADVPAANKAKATAELAKLKTALEEFSVIVANKDKQEVPYKQQECLNLVGTIEELMVDGFPFDIPKPYDTLPALKGRAEVEMTFKLAEGRASNPNQKRGTLTVVLDGYNAPVSAGNFVDLVQRKFYDGMDVQRSDGFVVQSGDPPGPEVGFVDPATRQLRKVPLEIMVKGDKVPLYGDTLEDVRRFREDPALPFNAFGTLALAREEFDNNSASSQFFFLLKESELTPSGTNILDGRYGVFGYVVDGQELLRDVKVGDIIESIKVTKGAEFLVNATREAPPPPQEPAAEEAPAAAE